MQVRTPNVPGPIDPHLWVRKRHNDKLYRLACSPLTVLNGTKYDPWTYVNGRFVHTPNPVWEAASAEFNRCYSLYMQLKPFTPANVIPKEAYGDVKDGDIIWYEGAFHCVAEVVDCGRWVELDFDVPFVDGSGVTCVGIAGLKTDIISG